MSLRPSPLVRPRAVMAPPPPRDALENESETTLQLRAGAEFVSTDATEALVQRSLRYLEGGYPVHFRGPAGSGKTTLSLHLAERLERPVVLLVGDDSFDTRRLVGGESGTRSRRVVDRYITSVTKVESEPMWLDRALTVACTEGCTLVYDEFNRAPPAANNVLLTVLEERMLVLPKAGRGETYTRVHPEFRAIFTSNPVDHVGAHEAQNALLDRMVTLDLDGFDRATEVAVTAARSGLPLPEAAAIVDMVRDFRRSREYTQRPTLRASLMIARMTAVQGLVVSADDPDFVQLCLDLLGSRLKPGVGGQPDPRHRQMLIKLIEHFCPPATTRRDARFGGVA
ncbi:gas vesicle protein GvpN [Roseococcus thiosulfatophilus]|uniref:gas vesicle protein GvpN n=1 Tax=Roseococcus thiosulfatophilus TaxID=35813 RepID=UPI001F5C837B|nr:gas vesicle protein GvpN [Roseococcus thiosulfatophilus]